MSCLTFRALSRLVNPNGLQRSEVLVHSSTCPSQLPQRKAAPQGWALPEAGAEGLGRCSIGSLNALRSRSELERWGPFPSVSRPTPPSTQMQVFPRLFRLPHCFSLQSGWLPAPLAQASEEPRPPAGIVLCRWPLLPALGAVELGAA